MNYNIPSVTDIEKCPGFGFRPNEECLGNFYLAGKNSGQAKGNWPILEIDLCAFEPSELLGLPTGGCDDYKYFFHRRQFADERNISYKRRTKTGYWKSTGNPREMKGVCTKRSLAFYIIVGSKSVRSGWIIQEYDNGGEYVIAKLQIKNGKSKNSKLRRRQIVPINDSTEENQIVYQNSEVQNVSIDNFTEENQRVHQNSEVQNDFTEENHIVYQNSEVPNVSTDDSTNDNQIDYHEGEDLSGFEDPNQNLMMVMTGHNEGEMTCLMASAYDKSSSTTESGGEYQSPAISSDPEYNHQNEITANYSASQDRVVPPHFADQNGKNMNTTMSTCNTGEVICLENFSFETENQFSPNESEGEWSPITALPYNSFPKEAIFNGEGIIFPPFSEYSSLHNPLTATNLDQDDWWSTMSIFN